MAPRKALPGSLPPRLLRRWLYAPVPEHCSGVRHVPERVGEVINLKDQESQKRSLAALLAKKHWKPRSRLSALYAASRERELTMKECMEIFRICQFPGEGD